MTKLEIRNSIGKKFNHKGVTYKITGYDPKRRNPFKATSEAGYKYLFEESVIKNVILKN